MDVSKVIKVAGSLVIIVVAIGYGLMNTSIEGEQSSAPFVVGDVLSEDSLRLIDRPALYGLADRIPGSRYAISDGKLIRVEETSMKVQSILRSNVEIAN